VSLSSVAQAQEAAAGAEALAASTTLSGYVSSSYTLQSGDGTAIGATNRDTDHFKLDVVSLTLASAQGAGEYATGYTVQFWAGPDDSGTGTDAETVELMQANIDLRLPFGNGVDLKVGQFGTVVGNESYDYNSNAFFQRSLAFGVEPTHHTGVLASYQVSDDLAVSLGLANNTNAAGAADSVNDSEAAVLASVSYTLPDSMGFAGGTGVKWGTVRDTEETLGADARDTDYLELNLPSIVENLTLQGTATYVSEGVLDAEIYGVHAGYALNDKTTLNLRYEWGTVDDLAGAISAIAGAESLALGLTYDLWENVTSRIEWQTRSADSATDDDNLAINLVYSF